MRKRRYGIDYGFGFGDEYEKEEEYSDKENLRDLLIGFLLCGIIGSCVCSQLPESSKEEPNRVPEGYTALGDSLNYPNPSDDGMNFTVKETDMVNVKEFLPGEHIISVPINKQLDGKKMVQLPYYEGYKCISGSTDGGYDILLYQNTEVVYCTSSKIHHEGEYVYNEIGMVESPTKDYDDTLDGGKKTFDVGQHILSVPISDPKLGIEQYYSHDGYEPISLSFSLYSKYDNYSGGCIIFVNTEPVECVKQNDEYASFGTPVELNKQLVY